MFATLVEILPDLILKALYKANKNKKVKIDSTDTAEKDETTQTSNMRNSKPAAVGSMITNFYKSCISIKDGTVLLLKPAEKYTAKWLLRSLQGFPKCALVHLKKVVDLDNILTMLPKSARKRHEQCQTMNIRKLGDKLR